MKSASLIFLLVCITYSQTASVKRAEEIQQYEEFLRNSVNGKPQAPSDQKLEELQPKWERSGKFEGDIVLNDNQINMLVDKYSGAKNAITNKDLLWPYKLVIYNISKSEFTTEQIATIESGIAALVSSTCLIFKERTPADKDYIEIKPGVGCNSYIGYQGRGAQIMNLEVPGCIHRGIVIHEFLHAIGFYHMQSNYDRDEYVEIFWDNIIPEQKHNFNKYTEADVTTFGTEYDYGSILHYSEYSFSVDGNKKTLAPIQETTEILGQREKLSEKDIIKLNKLYDCPGY